MKIAKGEVRQLLIIVGILQDKIGLARGLHFDDRSRGAFEKAQNLLGEAFDLCVSTRGEYEIINERKNKNGR
jgi:hypothetical protein